MSARWALIWIGMGVLGACDEVRLIGSEEDPVVFGYGSMTVNGAPATGERPVIVLRLSYADVSFRHDAETLRQWVFGPEPSVRTAFEEDSERRFSIVEHSTFEVQHPETLACAHHWTDLCPSVTAARWEWAVEEAMQIVLDDPATDFSDLDEDGSGVVEQHEAMLLVVNALPVLGPTNPFGSAGGITRSFPSECVGPRAGGKVSLCMQFSSVGEGTGVSTIRHELTHLLGAVDLYGVSSNNYLRSLMGPTIPRDHAEDVHEWFALDPWHKMVLGWEWPLVEDVSSGRSRVGLGLLVAEKAYKSSLIYDSERGTNEFFLLEFRDRRTVHDADTVGTGVGLWQAQVRDDLLPVRLPVEGGGDDAAILFYGAPDGALGSGWYWDSTHGEIRPTWYDGTPVPTSLTIEPIEAGDTRAVVNFVHDREAVTTTTTPTTTE